MAIANPGFVAVAVSVPQCTTPAPLTSTGDALSFVFPTDSAGAVPCGWLVNVAVTEASLGQYVTLRFPTFTVPCPGALIVRNGTSSSGAVLWEMCGDSARATPGAVRVSGAIGSTVSLYLHFKSPILSTYRVNGTLAVGPVPDAPLVCGTSVATVASSSDSMRPQVVVSTLAMSAARVLLADVDGDTDMDAVYVTNSTVEWMENIGGAAALSSSPFIVAEALYSSFGAVVVDDVTGDGRPDVIVGASKCDRVGKLSLYANSGGSGAFVFSSPEVTLLDAVYGVNAVGVFDIDGVSSAAM
jgi:hypothetical protein